MYTREAVLHSEAGLRWMPYDILYHIVGNLDLSDFNNLSRVNRSLYNILQNDQLAKRTVKVRLTQMIKALHVQKIEPCF